MRSENFFLAGSGLFAITSDNEIFIGSAESDIRSGKEYTVAEVLFGVHVPEAIFGFRYEVFNGFDFSLCHARHFCYLNEPYACTCSTALVSFLVS